MQNESPYSQWVNSFFRTLMHQTTRIMVFHSEPTSVTEAAEFLSKAITNLVDVNYCDVSAVIRCTHPNPLDDIACAIFASPWWGDFLKAVNDPDVARKRDFSMVAGWLKIRTSEEFAAYLEDAKGKGGLWEFFCFLTALSSREKVLVLELENALFLNHSKQSKFMFRELEEFSRTGIYAKIIVSIGTEQHGRFFSHISDIVAVRSMLFPVADD